MAYLELILHITDNEEYSHRDYIKLLETSPQDIIESSTLLAECIIQDVKTAGLTGWKNE